MSGFITNTIASFLGQGILTSSFAPTQLSGLAAWYRADSLLTTAKAPNTISGLQAWYRADSLLTTAKAPNTISGLVGWYRADQGITLSGSNITQWNDLSGNGYNLNTVNGTAPTFAANGGANSTPCANFSGGGYIRGSFQSFTSGAARTAIIISKTTTPAAILQFIFNDSTLQGFGYALNSNKRAVYLTSVAEIDDTTSNATNSWEAVAVYSNASNQQGLYVNNNTHTVGGSGTVTASDGNFYLGSDSLGYFFTGSIAEIIYYNRVLTASEINNLNMYLANRYGIGMSINAWNDQSTTGDANQNLAQATALNQPTFNASDATYNNQPTLSFDGFDYLSSGIWTNPFSLPETIIIIGNTDGTATDQSYSDCEGSSGRLVYNASGTSAVVAYDGAALNSSVPLTASPLIISVVFNGATSKIYVSSNTASVSGNAGTTTATRNSIIVGSDSSLTAPLIGKLAEVIVFNRILSDAEITGINTYASNRYGINLKVAALADQSGTGDANKNLAQSTWSEQPTLNVSDSAYNNQTTLSFTAASSQEMVSGTWATQLDSPLTAFFIGESAIGVNNGYLLDRDSSSFQLLMIDSANDIYMHGSAFIFSGTPISADPRVICGVLNGASSAIYVSAKTAAVVDDAGSGNIATLVVGQAESQYLQGKIAEVIIYSRALSASEVAQVLTYAGQRYGITIGA